MKERNTYKKGFTLVELMIALSVFAVIALFVVDIFITVMRYYLASVSNRTAQQDTKIALETITRYAKQSINFDWDLPNEKLTLRTKNDAGVINTIVFDKENVSGKGVIKMQTNSEPLQSLTTEDLNITKFEVSPYPGVPVILRISLEAEIEDTEKNIERGLTGERRIFLDTRVAIKGQYNL